MLSLSESQRWIRTICQSSDRLLSSSPSLVDCTRDQSCILAVYVQLIITLKEVQFLKEHCHLRRSNGMNVMHTYTLFIYVYEESQSCAFHRSRFTVENDVCAEFEIHLQKYETFDTSLETHHGPVWNLIECNMETQSLQCSEDVLRSVKDSNFRLTVNKIIDLVSKPHQTLVIIQRATLQVKTVFHAPVNFDILSFVPSVKCLPFNQWRQKLAVFLKIATNVFFFCCLLAEFYDLWNFPLSKPLTLICQQIETWTLKLASSKCSDVWPDNVCESVHF